MSASPVIDVLNDLLAAESRDLLPHLADSSVFISWASADEVESVQQMAAEGVEHGQWLVALILALRGSLGPRVGNIESAALHYVELNHLLPRVEKAKAALLRRYESAAPPAASEPRAAALVSKIAARHFAHLEQLRALMNGGAPTV